MDSKKPLKPQPPVVRNDRKEAETRAANPPPATVSAEAPPDVFVARSGKVETDAPLPQSIDMDERNAERAALAKASKAEPKRDPKERLKEIAELEERIAKDQKKLDELKAEKDFVEFPKMVGDRVFNSQAEIDAAEKVAAENKRAAKDKDK